MKYKRHYDINLYSMLWIFSVSVEEAVCNKLIFKTRVTVKVHPLSPPTLFLATTNLRGTRVMTHVLKKCEEKNWAASSEFGIYRLCEQRRFRRACASAQSRQNLRCSLIQAVSQEEPPDRKPDPCPFWIAGHAQLKFVMTECSKTQIRLTRHNWWNFNH